MVRSTNQTPEETRGGGGPRVKPRLTTPKMFATGKKRCPVAFLRSTYINVKTTGPVYLGVIDKPQTIVQYKKMLMDKHTVNNIIKTMKENSPKKLTNHRNARKTVVKTLRSSGTAPLATAPSKDQNTMTPVMKASKELCPTSLTMSQMQDKNSQLSPQCRQAPVKCTISAIAM